MIIILIIAGVTLTVFVMRVFAKKQRIKGVRIAGYQYAVNWVDASSQN
jgi:hypothetical protein